jgi:protein dithiol oxidoreductase (disulfide-forming)
MNRREFALRGTALGATIWLAGAARAQGGPVEGKDYVRVAQPVPMAPGKVEVVEFFGYWCPHCNSFEPTLEAWVQTLPADVNFRRIPIAFSPPQEPYQRLYFAIEALGLVQALHRKIFAAVHVQRVRFDKDADIATWVSANGADGAKVVETMKGFAVATKMRQAKQLSDAYRIDGVPTLGIHGRYMTSPSIAGSAERALAAANQLILMSKKA